MLPYFGMFLFDRFMSFYLGTYKSVAAVCHEKEHRCRVEDRGKSEVDFRVDVTLFRDVPFW